MMDRLTDLDCWTWTEGPGTDNYVGYRLLLLGWAVFVTFRVSMRDWLGFSENRFQLTIDY
jgi:hypothetical protein